mmetsp:Transcript_62170/g.178855  ORF Transcript_62170/g.178855 Transcript_62170/m.178855 type:complete len:273 (+) Transcript_62170:110-928(+)
MVVGGRAAAALRLLSGLAASCAIPGSLAAAAAGNPARCSLQADSAAECILNPLAMDDLLADATPGGRDISLLHLAVKPLPHRSSSPLQRSPAALAAAAPAAAAPAESRVAGTPSDEGHGSPGSAPAQLRPAPRAAAVDAMRPAKGASWLQALREATYRLRRPEPGGGEDAKVGVAVLVLLGVAIGCCLVLYCSYDPKHGGVDSHRSDRSDGESETFDAMSAQRNRTCSSVSSKSTTSTHLPAPGKFYARGGGRGDRTAPRRPTTGPAVFGSK